LSCLHIYCPARSVANRGSWVLQDWDNLLLAFIMLWAYLSFSQFSLWVENLQHEIPGTYTLAGGWAAIGIALIVLQFALPLCCYCRERQNPSRAHSQPWRKRRVMLSSSSSGLWPDVSSEPF
jgi:hypothetical protein